MSKQIRILKDTVFSLKKNIKELKKKNITEHVATQQKLKVLEKDDCDKTELIKCMGDFLNSTNKDKSNTNNKYSDNFKVQAVLMSALSKTDFKSLERILKTMQKVGLLNEKTLPCANSLIHWCMQVGLGALNSVSKINEPFVCIMDHWISSGNFKLFAVLRVPLSQIREAFSNKKALTLANAEVVCLKVTDSSSSEHNVEFLEELFLRIGVPEAIISDGDSAFMKTIQVLNEHLANESKNHQPKKIEHIYDISHYVACLLRKKYENNEEFKLLLSHISKIKLVLAQSSLAEFLPPTIRQKARFMNFSKHCNWLLNIYNLVLKPVDTINNPKHKKVIDLCQNILPLRSFAESFIKDMKIIEQICEKLKNLGCSINTIEQCETLLQDMNQDDIIKLGLEKWIEKKKIILKDLQDRENLFETLPVSSDIIETLFSIFKNKIKGGFTEPSRIILILPIYAGNIKNYKELLNNNPLKSVVKWIKNNIPTTILKRKLDFLKKNSQVKKDGGDVFQKNEKKTKSCNLLKLAA